MAFRTRDVHHIPSECRGNNSFHVVNRPHWKHRLKADKAKTIPKQRKRPIYLKQTALFVWCSVWAHISRYSG